MALLASHGPAQDEPRATLVFLHGMGDTLRGWSFLHHALELPWLETWYLQGPIPRDGKWAWYDLDENKQRTPRTVADIHRSRGQLVDFLHQQRLDPGQVVLGGFSQGAVIALETSLREDLPLLGTLCLCGYVPLLDQYPPQLGPRAASRRIFASLGRTDSILSPDRTLVQWNTLAQMGVPLEVELFDKGHSFDLDFELPRIRSWFRSLVRTPAPVDPSTERAIRVPVG